MVVGNMNAVILFILIGGLMTFFSKNMIIVLSVPLVLTSVLLVGNRVSEGFESGDKKDEDKPQSLAAAVAAAASADTSTTANATKKDKKNESNDNTALNAAVTNPLDDEPEGTATETTPENMSLYKKKNNRIDYASTLEDAYGDLNNILGKDGIKNLTSDTQKLMDQQMQLAEALKGMAPLIGDAKKMLAGMDISGLTQMAKSFGQSIPKE